MAKIGVCDAIIASVAMASKTQTQIIPAVGGLRASLNPENQADVEVISPDRGDGYYSSATSGGIPLVKLRYYQPQVGGVASSYSCEPVADIEPIEVNFNLTLKSIVTATVGWNTLQTLCRDVNTLMPNWLNGIETQLTAQMMQVRNILMSKMRAMITDINAKVMARYLASFGKNARTGNVTTQPVNLLNTTSGGVRSDGWAQVVTDFLTNEFTGTPIVIGGSLPSLFATGMGWSGLAATGIDYGAVATKNGMNFYFDPTADSVFGANQMAVLAPGMTKFVTRNKFAGDFTGGHGNSEYGTMTLPEFPGINFDVQAKQLDCDPARGNMPSTTIIISLDYGLFVMPSIYGVGDVKDGVNGVLRYTGVAVAA